MNHYDKRGAGRFLALTTLLLLGAVSTPALAVSVTMDNWRNIYMNGHYTNGGASEGVFLYSIHTTRQENLLANFDLSGLAGATALSDATLTFDVTAGYGSNSNTVELRQLNQFNADVDLDNSGSYFKDSPNSVPGALAWRDNAGNAISHLNYNNSVLDITSALLDSVVASPVVGSQLTFTIGQASIQDWIDGALPSTVALTMDNAPWSYFFFDQNAVLSFDSTPVPAPPAAILLALGLLVGGLSRRPGADCDVA